MIKFIRTNHIHIGVPAGKLEEAKLFYTDTIGLMLIERPNHLFTTDGYWFAIGDIELHIGVDNYTIKTTRHTAFEVTDADAARKHLVNKKVEIHEEPNIPGRKRFSFYDPYGNRMELLQLID
jgi:catechol 2,3-dioxygenase-like lactoylglutathione lyase family enzyme